MKLAKKIPDRERDTHTYKEKIAINWYKIIKYNDNK